jgi:hypothetical protein
LLSRCARNENTSHILPRAKDQSDPRTGAARQPAYSKRQSRLRSCRSEKNGQECTYHRPYANAGHYRPRQQTQPTGCGDGLESETARPVTLSFAINPHDSALAGTVIRNCRKATCRTMPMSCVRVDRKKP